MTRGRGFFCDEFAVFAGVGVAVAVALILLVAVVLATGRTLWDEFGGDLDT